ncbi:hypothetical protein [Petrotoga halophila]|uniref:hypothetical protein n=1 Tax=Petrotoga halophila TaxID=301141 RepID=UPI001472CD6F|nr:hypothetical protein [Petrotoga halophila]
MISIKKAATKKSEDIGCKKENTIAIKFYKKLGYKKTSETTLELSWQRKLNFFRMEKVL